MHLTFMSVVLFSLLLSQNQGIWVTRFALKDKVTIKHLIEFTETNRLTDVFIQVRGRGDAYYSSDVEPNDRHRDAEENLLFLMSELKKKNVKTHAWLNVFLLASLPSQLKSQPAHKLNEYNHWIDYSSNLLPMDEEFKTANDLTVVEGLYAVPVFQELENHYKQLVDELVEKFGFDGIHFDYFRLGTPEHGYHPKMRRLFFEETGKSVEPLISGAENMELKTHWKQFVANKFTRFLKRLTQERRELLWSVAVKPNPSKAKWQYGQDWETWLKDEIINFVVPMNYASSDRLFYTNMALYSTSKLRDKIWVGIATYNQSKAKVQKRIHSAKENNMNITIFSYNDLYKKDIRKLFSK